MNRPGVSLRFSVAGMHCASCGLLVDETIEELPGVKRSHTDVRRATSTVVADPDVVGAMDIIAAIELLGYTARVVEG